MLELKVEKIIAGARLPERAHQSDAGWDLFSAEEVVVPAGDRVTIATGLRIAIPQTCVGLIWDKSGLASNHGLTVLAGVIDAGYRGELKIVVANLSRTDYLFHRGDKVAQLLVHDLSPVELVEVKIDDETTRGQQGFGSSGR